MKLKKLLASILCVAMVLSTMSFTVFAEAATADDLKTAIATATDGETVTVSGNISNDESVTFTVSQDITIDLGSNTLENVNFNINASNVTIKNGTINNTTSRAATVGVFTKATAGTLTLTDVNITTGGARGIWVCEGSTLNFNGGSLTVESDKTEYLYGIYAEANATVNIDGAKISVVSTAENKQRAIAVSGYDGVNVTMTDGNITTDGGNYSYGINVGGDVEFSGGKIATNVNGNDTAHNNAIYTGGSAAVTGGTISTNGNYSSVVSSKGDVTVENVEATTNGANSYLVNADGNNQTVEVSDVEFAASVSTPLVGGNDANVKVEGENTLSGVVSGAINAGVVTDDAATENDSYIYFDLANLNAKESIEIKLYSGTTLLSTTELNQAGKDKGYLSLTSISANVEITKDSGSWDTTWEIAPIDNIVPDNAKLFVDGAEVSSTNTINMYNTDFPELAREWGDIEGVAISPKGTFDGGMVNIENPNATFITTSISNLYAKESIVLEIYDENGTLLATTTAANQTIALGASELSVYTSISGTDDWWTTTWEDEKLRADYVPKYGVLKVDGNTMNVAEIKMIKTNGEQSIEWADVPGVPAVPAGAINVILEPTDAKNVYNIKLQSADEYDIYEFVAAEFTFQNESTTVGGSEMKYEISGYTENDVVKTVVEQAADEGKKAQYIFRIPNGAEANRLSGAEFVIGQVTFIGQATTQFQGNIKFSIVDGEVDTTKEGTHLGKYYTVADENAKLNLDADAAIDSTVSEIKRTVAVNVAFNHNIDTANYWNGYQITATLKNNFGYEETQEIEISAINAGATTFADVPLGQITVTLKAPGFRTYTYKTVVEETADNGVLVLNFWNDVKRGAEDYRAIEAGKTATDKNFVVGDIVMDMNVDIYDLAAVTSYYGTYSIDTTANADYIRYDLNRDGDIDIRDVQYVLHTMGN